MMRQMSIWARLRGIGWQMKQTCSNGLTVLGGRSNEYRIVFSI